MDRSSHPERLAPVKIAPRDAWTMIRRYASLRIRDQVRALAFIIIYLVGFQILILNTAPDRALLIATGIGLTIFGLTFFLEGLFLGLMPLGERVGLKLPHKFGLAGIIVFGLLLGVGSTLAEPAIAALRTVGLSVTPWEAPLLFRLLESEPDKLILSIGIGVGLAVVIGMMRFYYGFSIKPLIYVIIPILLVVSAICAWNETLAAILGLAWDSGAVTTGPVTVPLVLALGIGVSRASGRQTSGAGGFGVVMLASALPVLGVLVLGLLLQPGTPAPTTEEQFFALSNRDAALRVVGDEQDLERMAFQRGTEAGRRSFYNNRDRYKAVLHSLAHDPAVRQELLGTMALNDWLQMQASHFERSIITAHRPAPSTDPLDGGITADLSDSLRHELRASVRAVLPLTALLLIVLLLILRDAPRHADEVALGVTFAFVGMTLLSSGIGLGLTPLGDQVGRPLPRVFQASPREEGMIVLQPFSMDHVHTTFAADGTPQSFFYLQSRRGRPEPILFDEANYNAEQQRYEHILKSQPLFGPRLTLVGIALVLLFAFGLGFGSTLAEPALRALGRTVEELTAGNIRGSAVVRAVSIGVGCGLVVGVLGILYDIPMIWMILPPYVVLILLTIWSKEDLTAIAWDCGGVTTGPVTVPLVMAMGLGIGGELQVVDGFGVLAMASAYPILTVLGHGLVVRIRQERSLKKASERRPHD